MVTGTAMPPAGCTDPERWMDAYLIAEAHRPEHGMCRCGRPLPCTAAERADEIMAETTQAARAADAERERMRAITQELPMVGVEPEPVAAPAPVGARFARPRGDEVPAPQTGFVVPEPPAAPPTGARFYRERKPKRPRHRG